jgi:hypothetical protein
VTRSLGPDCIFRRRGRFAVLRTGSGGGTATAPPGLSIRFLYATSALEGSPGYSATLDLTTAFRTPAAFD